MAANDQPSLFRPGAGVQPPVLAGRENEQKVLRSIEHDLRHKTAYEDVLIVGPRGVGKTCLTHWFARELKNSPSRIGHCQIQADRINATEDFVEAILRVLPTPILEQISAISPDQFQLGPSVARFTWTASAYEKHPEDFDEAIAKAMEGFPFAACIDEGHLLKPDVLRGILNLSQFLKGEREIPFTLMLTGTPRLQTTLNQAEATFSERSTQLRLDVLEKKEAARALTEPFKEKGIELPEQGLDEVIEKTQCYPYFIQVMGKSIERAMTQRSSQINEDVLEQADDYFEQVTSHFYGGRYRELLESDLEAAAMSVSRVFQGSKDTDTLTDWEITDHLETELNVSRQEAKALFQKFVDKGFVWDVVPGRYRPGIPSLMTYVMERDRSSRTQDMGLGR